MTIAVPAASWSAFDVSSQSSPAPGTSIIVRGLTKNFGATCVVRDLDLHASAGQFLAIVGRSGCGKSTLLRLLAGLDRPDAGQISFGAWPPAEVRHQCVSCSRSRDCCLGQALWPMSRLASGRPLGAIVRLRRSLPWAWPTAPMTGLRSSRVGKSNEWHLPAHLLALDEPLGALDALTRIEMQRLLEVVWLRERFTAILVTHDVAEAVMLADHILVLEGGRISLDVNVDLPRPRHRGLSDAAELEERILRHLLRNDADARQIFPELDHYRY
jgi:sulfonate transport system ATP-binding protein